MNTLSINTLIEKINGKKNGQIGTIQFYSVKNTTDNDVIYKMTKTQFHKCDRTHTKDYVAPTYTKTENVTYIVPRELKQHNGTGNILLNVIPFKSRCHKTTYFNSKWEQITKAEYDARVTENKKNSASNFYTVNARQIISYV